MGIDREERSVQLTIKTHHKLPPDIDAGLFDSFFHKPEFVAWIDTNRTWQLHLSGSPGCGKTTLSSLIAAYLKRNTPYDVATVFIQSRASYGDTGHTSCIDDILIVVLEQLQPCEGMHRDTTDRRVNGRLDVDTDEKTPDRLIDLLLAKLSRSPSTFLIIDGYDQLPMASQRRLENTLKILEPRLKVLLTRRNIVFQDWDDIARACNECDKNLEQQFWHCSICNTGEIDTWFDVCYSCKEKHIWCNLPGHQDALVEPYDHVDVEIRHDEGKSLELFVIRDLEREYSKQDSLLIQGENCGTWTAQSKAQFITHRSRGDLAITKLLLDQVREDDSFQNVEMVSDRLPRGVIALYDSELDRIEVTTPKEMELVLVGFLIIDDGIPIEELEKALQHVAGDFTNWTDVDYPYVRNILRLARGLLSHDVEDRKIYPYHQDFMWYVREKYNQDIVNCEPIFNRYLEWERQQRTRESSLGSECPEVANLSLNNPESIGIDQKMDSKAPPAVLSRQSSTDSTDSGYYSSSPPPERESDPGVTSVHRRVQEARRTQSKHITAGPAFQAHSLCIFCQETILQNHANRGDHHRSVSRLKIAADQGCSFCSSIYIHTKECARKTKLDYRVLHDCSARYWTLRTTGRTSNGYDVCVITFQVSKEGGTRCSKDLKIATERFFVVAETDLSHIPTAAMLSQSTQLKDAGAQITSWIRNCDENHPGCEYRSTDDFVPTRLVDIGTGDSHKVRIVETKKNGITRPYVTLSHCWGKHLFLTLRRVNEELLTTEGVNISELTRNFQEAIQVARFIGMRYIWIDSLCIVQGEDGDFKTEGQYMHKVYRFSYCNIVAADSPDSTHGLFRERDAKRILPAVYEAGDDSKLENGTWRILKENLWQNELLETPIYTRGWVFQERMLSPRILHFTKHQIYWDCSTISACETLPEGLPFNLDRFAATDRHWRGRLQETTGSSQEVAAVTGINDDSMEEFWKTALLKYTECDLTNQGDKAVAVWSIAKLVRDQLAHIQQMHNPDGPVDEYGGGLWSIALHNQLAWRARDVNEGARLEDLQAGSPSWSWTSVKGAICAQDRLGWRDYYVERHGGGEVRFQLENSDGNRDEMPVLKEPFSMDMNGYLEEARLVQDGDQPGTLRLEILLSRDCTATSSGEQMFLVYPDEKLDIAVGLPLHCHFAVLAASKDEYFTLSERGEHTQNTTYNGLGLILEPYEVFRSRQRLLFKEVLSQFFKKSFDINTSRWDRDASVKRVANLGTVLRRDKLHAAGQHFRRIGAVEFRNVTAKTWHAIEGHGRKKFWLD